MVKKCSTCEKHGRVCKVHIRSGKCSECVRRGQRCNVRVTESEFSRLTAERNKLAARIKETREEQKEAMRAQEKAMADLRVAQAREERLRQQMDFLDRRAEEAIAVEEKSLEELEALELGAVLSADPSTDGPGLALSPSTWGAFEGFPSDFWEASEPLVVPSDTVATSGGS